MINRKNLQPLLQRNRIIYIIIATKLFGLFFALEIFHNYTPLVDSQLYVQGHYNDAAQFRTWITSNLASSIHSFGGVYFTHFTFALISASGLIYFYINGGNSLAPLLSLLLPSALVWTSIAGKEALYVGALGTILVLWSHSVVRQLNLLENIIVFSLGFFCFLLRPHYSLAIVWLFGSLHYLQNRGKYGLFFPAIILIFLVMSAFFSQSEIRELINMGYTGIDPQARASRFETFGIIPNSDLGFDRFKSYLVVGTILGIVGPTLSEVSTRLEFLPFFIEGLLIFISPLLVYIWAIGFLKIQDQKFKLIFFVCLMPSILICMVVHSPFGILNPGSAIRWRTNFEYLFYLAPILLTTKFTMR